MSYLDVFSLDFDSFFSCILLWTQLIGNRTSCRTMQG